MASTEDAPVNTGLATAKRKAAQIFELKFPEAGSVEMEEVQFRDVSLSLEKLPNQTVFLRPTQMGKSFLFHVANLVYDKKRTKPKMLAFEPQDVNSWFVMNVTFLNVYGDLDSGGLDESIGRYVRKRVDKFLARYGELQPYYKAPDDKKGNPNAGEFLEAVADAVSGYGAAQDQPQRFMVLVDEYDKPAREVLLGLIGSGQEARWDTFKNKLHNYRGFFSACKMICAPEESYEGKVWVTGVTPLALNLISDFNPERVTFREDFGDIIGYRKSDVHSMLDLVADHFPFESGDEKTRVRAAIEKLANRLYFREDTPLFHTRMVNSMMNALLNAAERRKWLSNLSRLPAGRIFQEVPHSVFGVIQRQKSLAVVARKLSANRKIHSQLNENLNLADVLKREMDEADYLTLLVHLGIASVRREGDHDVFEATSTYFREPFFRLLVSNCLAPLFSMTALRDIYDEGVKKIEEFMNLLPVSGMKNMIKWAESERSNKILELQFQGSLVGELANSLWDEEVKTSQEDVTGTGDRTDVRIAGENLVLVLELKQHCKSKRPPKEDTKTLRDYHKQLADYVADLTQEEDKKHVERRLVAGFLVIMYNDGKGYHVEPTK